MKVFQFSVVVVRLAGLILFLSGLLRLLTAIAASWGKVGLVYWQTFLLTVVLPPVILALAGLIVLLLARPIGRFLARGLESAETD
ncbi:hypothetical protein [Puniceicoccus vermicola]|uniref:Uncharacterized protein n=1 Tax=Puniceicoccus vermicola TaxID=388746 RepID=A0A7X1AWS7_9BACT|nr:hypothetical protein [Puniceicoccus vermicola]MBC2601450.1 hypothetical protein [Puniceicoccus vermicola]